ncbi:hypothetical protein FQN54_003937 [Arachnomyces sp. PD_36]|nr:hypothetical protein FQN54_003937 [Arachnomyces sp. PD_36]
MSNNSSSLYGISRPKATASKKDLTSSSTLAFTTHLSSLISKDTNRPESSTSGSSTRARARPSKSKSDIFSTHNKNTHKRAAADLSDNGALSQVHQRVSDIGEADAATLHRSKRKMTEKAKLYADLKSGNHLIDSDDDEESSTSKHYSAARRGEGNSLVDFDRKWAEEEDRKARKRRENGEESDSNSNAAPSEAANDSDNDSSTSLIDYEDEFGRSRRGTKSEAARASRLKSQSKSNPSDPTQDPAPTNARPSRPSNLIHGPTIQSSAFNPSSIPGMSSLSQKRDRSPTPPPEVHYDAEGEVRNRGTGFYAFSRDEGVRGAEMEELMGVRKETERERERVGGRRGERERKREERRREVERVRGRRRAEVFLRELGEEGIGEGEEGEEGEGDGK